MPYSCRLGRPFIYGSLVLALALVVAACGGNDTAAETAGTPVPSPTTQAMTPSSGGGSPIPSASAAAAVSPSPSTTADAPASPPTMPGPPGASATGTPTPTTASGAGSPTAGPDPAVTTIVMTPQPTSDPNVTPTSPGRLNQLPVEIFVSDGKIDPAVAIARSGELTLKITNNGTAQHTIEIAVMGMIFVSPGVDPGTTVTWDVQITTPGEYELYSTINGVREDGMLATLKVVE